MSRILLLHGILDGPQAWDRVAPRLRAVGHDVLVHDAQGLLDPRAVADDAAALLPAHVVGHSRGATSACWLAVERPDLVQSLVVVASPPQPTEAFRAAFARRLPRAENDAERRALEYLASIPEEDFPMHALRRTKVDALVVEYEDDPLYAPTHTMFWRMFLPYADFERVPGGHRAFAESESAAVWLAERILRLVEGHRPRRGEAST